MGVIKRVDNGYIGKGPSGDTEYDESLSQPKGTSTPAYEYTLPSEVTRHGTDLSTFNPGS